MWNAYRAEYRQREVTTLMHWIAAGQSGSVVGLPGCGRSNLLDYICYRGDVLRRYLPDLNGRVALIPVNLYDLPSCDVATFHRTLLRAFHYASSQLSPELQQATARFHQATLDEHDPFVTQSALHDLLSTFRNARLQVVLILNYLHHFIQTAPPETVRTLRGLRDRFKGDLCFIAGLTQDVVELPHSEWLVKLYELLDRNICWIGAMEEQDARNLIDRATATASVAPATADVETMLQLSGNFPVILKLIATWWMNTQPRSPRDSWLGILERAGNIRLRLREIWEGLTQEEQAILREISSKHSETRASFIAEHTPILTRLALKGVCRTAETCWEVRGELLAAYVRGIERTPYADIWIRDDTEEIYQGTTQISDLTPLEAELLRYLVSHPYVPHDKESLIRHLWPDKPHEMSDNDLQQLIYRLRKKVDTHPPKHIVTWKGRPGGYRFYPEGYLG